MIDFPFVQTRTTIILLSLVLVSGLLLPMTASAHDVSQRDASFVQSNQGVAVAAFMYLGAKHMVTGYDHLAFLVGVIFFLYRLKDVVQYVSLFTLGHSITLLAGVLGDIHANSYIVDAIIGFSVVYKAFDNMDGFKRFLGFEPNTKLAVLVFGLFHGFGLATKLQQLDLSKNGLVTNIVSFNVGVEIGQVLALTAVLIILSYLANTQRVPAPRVCHQHCINDSGLRSYRLPDRRILSRGITHGSQRNL